MTRLQIRPVPHAARSLVSMMQRTPDEFSPTHEVMQIVIRSIFDKGVTERDALLVLQDMLQPELRTAEGIARLAMEYGKLAAVMKETFHYQLLVRHSSKMAVLYIPMGGDFAILTNPSDVVDALDALRSMNTTLSENELGYRLEVPAGFNQLVAAGATGADVLLQEAINAKLSGEKIPSAAARGYVDQQAEVYTDAVREIDMCLTNVYFNLVYPGWYDYRVDYPNDWEAVIIFTRKQVKLELVKPDPDEKEPA